MHHVATTMHPLIIGCRTGGEVEDSEIKVTKKTRWKEVSGTYIIRGRNRRVHPDSDTREHFALVGTLPFWLPSRSLLVLRQLCQVLWFLEWTLCLG
jgi:hypothetical protein